MLARRLSIITALTFGLLLAWSFVGQSGQALARSSSSTESKAKSNQKRTAKRSKSGSKSKKARKTKVCKTRKGKRRCRWVTQFQGHGVAAAQLREEPLPRPSGDIWVYAVNFREEVKVNIYDQSGAFDQEALAELDNSFRCRRTKESRAVDPRLYEVLSIIYDHFGQQRIELVSGFRNQSNQGSRHVHASAMDIRIPGVSARELYEFASSLDGGGMGIGLYPNSQFVHVDYRAPGEKSYRWTDYSEPEGSKKKSRKSRRKRPQS